MSTHQMRLTPNTGRVASGINDVRVAYSEENNYQEPACAVATNEAAQGCTLFKAGHNVHWIQFNLGVSSPLYPVEILSVHDRSFMVMRDGEEITFYTHRPEQIQALIDHYGVGVYGWVHDRGLFESQGHFLCVTTDEAKFVPCSVKEKQ